MVLKFEFDRTKLKNYTVNIIASKCMHVFMVRDRSIDCMQSSTSLLKRLIRGCMTSTMLGTVATRRVGRLWYTEVFFLRTHASVRYIIIAIGVGHFGCSSRLVLGAIWR